MDKERIRQFEEEWQEIKESLTYKHSGEEMVLMSILSDVQEEIGFGLLDRANDKVNFVKYVLSKIMEEKRERE